MPAPPIAGSRRYVPAGRTRFYLVELVADVAAPTRAELDAGVDVSPELAALAGWRLRAATITERAVGEKVATSRAVWLEMDSDIQSLVLYADLAGADVRSLLPVGASTHVVILHGGDVEGHLMDVWPVEVAARPREIARNVPSQIQFDFTVTGQPAPDVAVPPHA